MHRRSPIKHVVHHHIREHRPVRTYVRGHGQHSRATVTQHYPSKTIKLEIINLDLNKITPGDYVEPNFEQRVQYFIDSYKNGQSIPPVFVHKLPNGEYKVLDGNARIEAFRRLGVTTVPAVENTLGESLAKLGHVTLRGAKAAGQFAVKSAKAVGRGVKAEATKLKPHVVKGLHYAKMGLKAVGVEAARVAVRHAHNREAERLIMEASSANPAKAVRAKMKLKEKYPEYFEMTGWSPPTSVK